MKKNVITAVVLVVAVLALSQFVYVLPIHITAFFLTITAVAVADAHALLWVIGTLPQLPKSRMHTLHMVVSYGLLVLITTGCIMFWPVRDFLLYETAFQIKILFVAALTINGFVIGRHMHIATTVPFSDVAPKLKATLLVSGCVSTTSWIGAFVAAQFLGL